MMNDEMNIHDEFEDWLKQSADKHRMYPSDKLWRNINEQLHEQPNWPALTFGAILTLALLTATLVFLHPTKNVFNTPDYTSTITPSALITKANNIATDKETIKMPERSKQKEPIYAFNNPGTSKEPEVAIASSDFIHSAQSVSIDAIASSNNEAEATTYYSPVSKTAVPKQLVLAQPTDEKAVAGSTDDISEIAATSQVTTDQTIKEDLKEETPADYSSTQIVRLPTASKKRWHVEVYGGSNISYRRLRESMIDNHAASTQPTGTDRSDLSNIVSQKPAIGANAGVAFVYAVSDRFRIKTGVQLNFRQYNIDAYKSSFERTVLLLNNGFYYPDSVYTYSAISNAQGKAIALSNKYYQIGVPVGIEWTAVKLPNLHFNLAANVQPTYQINSNNYLLTSDYKNYVQAPGLLRRININAGVEATANFNAGNLQWQVGPQVLYQTLPTQKGNYSIHEHLIDYGVRVGIIKRL